MSTIELPLPAPVAPAPVALNWPAPHHMRVIDPAADAQPERGLVTLNDGGKFPGSVVRIDFEAATLEFQPEVGTRRTLPFAFLRSLCLARAVELERIPLAVPPGSLEALPSWEKRRCAIVFTDESTLEADVVAVVPRKAGLFLFVSSAAGETLRWFVPSQGVAHYRVGEPLGETLRARKSVAQEALDAGLQTQQRLQSTRIGDYLAKQGSVTREQLDALLVRRKTMSHLRLGDAMVQEKLISSAERDAALAMQAADRKKPLGEILVEMGVVTSEEIRRVLAEQLGVPSVNLARFQYDPSAIEAITGGLARKYTVMPLYRTGTRIAVGIENPLSWEALQELELYTGLKVDPAMAARDDLLVAIAQFYGDVAAGGPIARIVAKVAAQEAVSGPDDTSVELVNKMIRDAYDRGATDIHVESMPGDKPSRVRFRADGVLAHYIDVPSHMRCALVSRLKAMAKLDDSERRRPQDGRIRFEEFGARRIELRVVTVPTANGLEDVVLRILAAPRALTLDQLAFAPRILALLKAMAAKSSGLVLVCGPTGSGTTTTLHSLLAHINTPELKIWTVEDPIEISQEGLCQVQVNAKLGLTFPEVLRSFLAADPDVIMAGEMRDAETARTVVAASLSGHLVLSTLHTASAVETIVRLLDLGLDPFNFSDALLGIVGQRLVRRLCTACRTPRIASREEIEVLARQYCLALRQDPAKVVASWRSRYGDGDGELTLHSAAACPACDRTGYKGYMGVHELLVASPAIRTWIQAKATSAEILREALAGGMVTLQQDAIEKILQGHLDFKQVKAACL